MTAAKTTDAPGNGPGNAPGRRPWTQRQLWLRIAAIFAAGALVAVLHFTGTLDRLQHRLFPPRVDWKNDYSVAQYLRDRVVDSGLTTDSKDCLLFIINGNDPLDAQRFRVVEKSTGKCPGPRGKLLQLFTLRIDRNAGTVQTDNGSPGMFHPLPQ